MTMEIASTVSRCRITKLKQAIYAGLKRLRFSLRVEVKIISSCSGPLQVELFSSFNFQRNHG